MTDELSEATAETLIEEARARFELLRRQERELDGNDIALIREECNVQMAKCVVNLKGAAQWAAEYGDRLIAALTLAKESEHG